MAFNCLTKLLLLAAVLGLAFGGRPGNCHPRRQANVDLCREQINAIVVDKYTDHGVGSSKVKIVYSGNKDVNCGNGLSPLVVYTEPKITYNPPLYIGCSNVTLILFDPDRPFGQAPHLHWMVVNVQSSDIRKGTLGAADVTSSYFPPYINGDKHIFFIYCQNGGYVNPKKLKKYEFNRDNFPVKDFAKTYGLGDPIVGQYFTVNVGQLHVH